MKKTLIALAAVAAATGAMAQATISGTYSVSYQKDLTGSVPQTATNSPLTASGVNGKTGHKGLAVTDASFRIAASEDLGGGLRASADMTLETSFSRGAAVTRADSGISVAGGFGTVAFRNTRNSDLIAGAMSSAVNISDSLYDSTGILSRANVETLSFTTPELMKGLRASITYVEPTSMEGNQFVPTSNTTSYIVGLSYAQGPLTIALAHKSKPGKNTAVAANGGLIAKANTELSVAYDLGVARVAYGYDGATQDGTFAVVTTDDSTRAASLTAKQSLKAAHGVSVTVPMGAVTLGVNYAKRGDAKYTAVGATYALSKRTSLTAATGKKSFNDSVTANQTALENRGFNGTQYRVALRHTF